MSVFSFIIFILVVIYFFKIQIYLLNSTWILLMQQLLLATLRNNTLKVTGALEKKQEKMSLEVLLQTHFSIQNQPLTLT